MMARNDKRYTNNIQHVLVKNIPADWNEYIVVDFMEVCSNDKDVKTVEWFGEVKSMALVEFTEPITETEFDDLIERGECQKEQIKLSPLMEPDGLIVQRVPTDTTLNKVCSYFTKSHGKNIITEKKRNEKLECVILHINNINVVDELIKIKLPRGMKVKLFYKRFHGYIISHCNTLLPPPSHTNDDDDDDDVKEDSDRNNTTPVQKVLPFPVAKKAQDVVKKDEVELVSHQIILMKKCSFGADCPCKITIDENKRTIVFEGTQPAIDAMKETMFEKMEKIHKVSKCITEPFYNLLRSVKGAVHLESIFKKSDSAMGYVSDDRMLVCAGFGELLTKQFLETCMGMLITNRIEYKHTHTKFIEGDKWKTFKTSMQSDYAVSLHIEKKMLIIIQGLNEDVSMVTQELKKTLEKNEYHVKTVVVDGAAKSKCLCRFFQNKITDMKVRMGESNGCLQDELSDVNYKIVLSGPPSIVEQLEKELRQLEKNIWHKKLTFERDMSISPRELKTLVNGLKNADQVQIKLTFEEKNKCCLEFLNLKPEQRNTLFRPLLTPTTRSDGRSTRSKSHADEVKELKSVTFHQTTINLKKGDITKEKADVLVNVLTSSLNSKHTKLGQSFYNACACGAEFVKILDTEKAKLKLDDGGRLPAGSVIKTKACKPLGCQHIYHMILDKWRAPDTKNVLETGIKHVLDFMDRDKLTSIAFPALGCGRLFNFPADQMALTALTILQQEVAKHPTIKKITFVIYDNSVHDEFLVQRKRFSPTIHGAVGERAEAYSSDDSDSDHDTCDSTDLDEDSDEFAAIFTADTGIGIYASSKDICKQAKQTMKTFLKENYLYKDCFKIDTSCKTHFDRDTQEDMKREASKLDVDMQICNTELPGHGALMVPEIRLQGETKSVLKVKAALQELLYSGRDAPKRGTVKFLRYMAKKDASPPPYWESYTGLFNQMKKMIFKPGLVKIKASSVIYKAIEGLVKITWKSDLVGQGCDAKGLSHKDIQVIGIERIENFEIYRKYHDRRQEFFKEALKNRSSYKDIGSLPGSRGPILTTEKSHTALKHDDLYPEVNEHYVFHGTKPEVAKVVGVEGFDVRNSNNGMLGHAIYFAEESTKSDQYADRKDRNDGDKKLLLCRVLFGDAMICDMRSKDCKKPPCKDPQHQDTGCTLFHGFYDSVISERKGKFREFAVYDSRMVYPEYVITYKRLT
ncbi:uncharacterized protein LOC126830553 [Patella vulgata]|uniref:uncharacterized protein LOC126830553 n=1 Tax=Patella vulgata TaxID=6465 RepID=UPI0024A86422|nr:uncharacterized protein LOC126830553 [Patella vulgata]